MGDAPETVELDQGDFPAVIAGALVRAQRAVRGLEKDGENKFHGYRYASAEAVTAEARQALNGADLAVLRTGWRLDPTWAFEADQQTAKGVRRIRSPGRVFARFDLVHSSGARRRYESSVPVMPEAGKSDDKAELAALTGLTAYFLLGLLQIPRDGGAGDIDGREDRDDLEPPRGSAPSSPREPEPERDPNLAAKLIELIAAASSKAELLPVREAAAHPKTGLRGPEFDRVVSIYNERVKHLNAAAPQPQEAS